MINVYPLKGGYGNGFIVTGHAGYAPHGADIVCASVSAVTQTIVMGLEKVAIVEKNVKSGYMLIEIPAPSDVTDILIDMMVEGLLHISLQHKDYLQVWKDGYIDEDARVQRGYRTTQSTRQDSISARAHDPITPYNHVT